MLMKFLHVLKFIEENKSLKWQLITHHSISNPVVVAFKNEIEEYFYSKCVKM